MKNDKRIGNFKKITVNELPILVSVIMKSNDNNLDETLLELELIDDLLLLADSKLLLNNTGRKTAKGFLKNNFKGYHAVIDGRIGKYIEDLHGLKTAL